MKSMASGDWERVGMSGVIISNKIECVTSRVAYKFAIWRFFKFSTSKLNILKELILITVMLLLVED